jgi:antibiotic biosynthesis monooxygenase (ABM) superfamily enzyme
MRTASTAEWILCRLTTKERAATMVGDLIEGQEKKGLMRFWLSVAGVALSLFWRRPIAFIAAFYAGMLMFGRLMMEVYGINALHRPPGFWMPVFDVLILAGSTLWAVSLYAAIRYGLQERSALLSIAYAGLVTAVIYLWWQPVVLVACIAAALLIATASILKSKSRKELLVVLVAVSIGSAARLLAFIPAALYQHFLYRGPWGDREMQEHPSLGWVVLCMMILSFWVMTTAWSMMRGWLMRNQMLESRDEMLYPQERISPDGNAS